MITPLVLFLAAAAPADNFEEAKQAFREGVVALDAGRAADAVISFRRSLSLRQSPAAWFNLGMSCRQVMDHVCVVTALEKYLTYEGAESGPQLTEALQQSREEVASLSIAIDGEFETVKVDGKENCNQMPCRLVVLPGSHTVVVHRAGSLPPLSKSITAVAGEEHVITIQQPSSPPPPNVTTPVPEPPPVVLQPAESDEAAGPPWWVWAGAGAVVVGAIVAGVVAARPGVDGGSLDTVLVLERMQ